MNKNKKAKNKNVTTQSKNKNKKYIHIVHCIFVYAIKLIFK